MTTTPVSRVFVAPAILAALAVFAVLFATAMPVGAASARERRLVATIPFDFYFGDTLFQAGEYSIQDARPVGAAVSVQSVDGNTYASLMPIPAETKTNPDRQPFLMFTRYPDGKSYLREIQNPFALSGYFRASRMERQSESADVKPASATVAAK